MSQFGTDDLAGIVIRRDLEFVGFAEGVIRSWDPSTFEHTINVRGTDLHDLDVAAGTEALTYAAGETVILTKWKPRSRKGSATYRIGMGGRVIRPGSGAADQAIAFMTTSLGVAVARTVFGEGIIDRSFDSNLSQILNIDGVWEPLEESGGSPDMAVSDIEIISGRMLVVMSANMRSRPTTGETGTARMAFDLDGPTSRSVDMVRGMSLGKKASSSAEAAPHPMDGTVSRLVSEKDLDPGTYTLNLYGQFFGTGGEAQVLDPALIIIPM